MRVVSEGSPVQETTLLNGALPSRRVRIPRDLGRDSIPGFGRILDYCNEVVAPIMLPCQQEGL